jgi:hypothetical protein
MKKILLLTSTMFLVLFVFGQKLPFQGKLIESGTPVNGTRSIEVGLPDLSWSETHAGVQITDGLYFIVLGSISPLPPNLFAGTDERQLTLSVDGTALSPVILYKPLTNKLDSLYLKGPGNGLLRAGFGTGSAVNENLPYLKLNGNLSNTFDRISLGISSNQDNTTEYGNISVSSTNGLNNYFSPGYLALNHNDTASVSLFSQNWGNKGYSGTILLRGRNKVNFEIGSKHWENADLPQLQMRGTTSQIIVYMTGEKYQEASVDKERGQMIFFDTDDKKTIINPSQISLHDAAGSRAVSIRGTNHSSNKLQGLFELFGNTSPEPFKRTAVISTEDWGNGDFGKLELFGDRAQVSLVDKNNIQRIILGSIEGIAQLDLRGPNSSNLFVGKGDDPDHGILRMNGKTNLERVRMFVKTDWDNQEKGTIELHGQDGNKVGIIPTQFALHKSDWSFYGRLFAENNAGNLELYGNASGVVLKKDNGKQGAKLETVENSNGFSGRLILSGPNNENIFLGTKDWETSGLPLITLKGSESADKISLIILADDPNTAENEERGILDLHDSNGNGMVYGHNGVWSDKGPFSMWSGARVNGTLELNGNFTGSGTQTYTSDQRLKKDIQPLGENILGKIESLEGVSYYWRKDEFPKKNFSDDQQIGLIAQELESQFPALVKTNDDGYKAVNYNGFTAVLLQAVKELNAKVEKLESENQKLQAELSASASNRTEIDQLKSQMEILTKLVMEKSTIPSGLSSAETFSSAGLK